MKCQESNGQAVSCGLVELTTVPSYLIGAESLQLFAHIDW